MFSKEELERMRLEGEKLAKQWERKPEGDRYSSEAGLPIECLHCKHDRFEQGKALLNTRGLTFFDLEWLNDDATTLICKRCGFIQWFGKQVYIRED